MKYPGLGAAKVIDVTIEQILKQCKTIAVIGLSSKPEKAGYYVPHYLEQHGYRILGVSPALGRTLIDLDRPIDLVLLFRRAEELPGHLAEILQVRPSAVWMQTGIRHSDFKAALEKSGISVIEDRCMMIEHRGLFG